MPEKRLKQRSQPHSDSALTLLSQGDADPFSTAGITITPQINRILTFARDVCLPAFYFVDSLRDSSISADVNKDVANSSGWISSPAAKMGWQQVVDALGDKCTALACLSTYLALMAICNINPAKATEASLKMRAGSSALLRQKLLHHESQPTDRKAHQELLWQVFWHFYAEFFAGNMAAAQVHGKMLRQSCENAEEGLITDHFLDSVIFVDSHMAAKYMVPPVLDVSHWVPNIYASTWDKVDSSVAEITGERGEGLHPCMDCVILRDIFVRTRQSLLVLRRSDEAQAFNLDFETLYYWLNSHSYVDSGTLIQCYLNLVEAATKFPETSDQEKRKMNASASLGFFYTQAALCQAALFAIRDIGQEVRINGVDVIDASTTITQHLKDVLEKAMSNCTLEEASKYRPAHLWCAFIGALIEQRHFLPVARPLTPPEPKKQRKLPPKVKPGSSTKPPPPSTTQPVINDPSTMHFNHLLAEIAYFMGLLSWQQINDVLKGFIYSDLSDPHGSRWFWKTMGAYLDERRKISREEREMRKNQAGSRAQPTTSTRTSPQMPVTTQSPPQSGVAEVRRWNTVATPAPGMSSGRSTPAGARQVNEAIEHRRWSVARTQDFEGGGSGAGFDAHPGQQSRTGYG
jgi:hypothetical protein